MMDSIKTWLLEVALKTMGPSAIRGAILGLSAWLITKAGLLASFGIVSDAAAHTTTIYWDKLSAAIIVGLPAVIAGVIKMLQHQTQTTVTHLQAQGVSNATVAK